MSKVNYLSPMVPSYNILETVKFFVDLLDFEIVRDDVTYVIIHKDGHLVHFLRAGEDIGEMEFYVEVDDVDKIWETKQQMLEDVKVRPPFDREYGMREMHIIIPHTKTLMFLGQPIKP